MCIHDIGPNCLGKLHQHHLELPDAHNDIGLACLEVTAEVEDGVDEEGNMIGVDLVEAVDGEDNEGFFVGGGEAIVVEETKVVAEPDYCSMAEGNSVGGVAGAVGLEGKKGCGGGWQRRWI